jgi:gas vesicle protein
MGDGHDRYDNRYEHEGGSGASFVIGLLTGTVLGAGLGMLFAPKSGADLRNQLSEQAGNLANTAQEGYRRASETAGEWAEKGRGAVDKARESMSRGADEASRYARETAADWAEKGRGAVDKARDAVAKGMDEASRHVREAGGPEAGPRSRG